MNLEKLPGAELILPGLEDLRSGKNNTVGALLIAIALTRLTNAGLTIPKTPLVPEPELTLYAQLKGDRSDAYPYYNALLASLVSFCNALEQTSKHRKEKSYATPLLGAEPSHHCLTLPQIQILHC